MIYFYARVSTQQQNLDRQLEISKEYFKSKDYQNVITYQEKQSGKDFNSRKIYQKLRSRIKSKDTIIILSLDRLGRNYEEIKQEWSYLVKKGCEIEVIDMPILNTNNNINGLDGKFISDLVLGILAYVAQKEREKINERQLQGIKIAKEKGVRFGRPKKEINTSDLNNVISLYIKQEISLKESLYILNISKGTFYRFLNNYKEVELKGNL